MPGRTQTPPIAGELGDLITEVRAGLVDELWRGIRTAGFGDVRVSHDCVFRYLTADGARLRDIADQSHMTPQSIGEHVDELERLGYVERVPDPSDRRAKLIRPTDKAIAYMAAGRRVLEEIGQQWVGAVGPKALTQVRDTLADIKALYEPPAAD
jgi:DNA-binding MarR family transcriptional regulator